MTNTQRGLFITLEGGEGAGKTTQTRLIEQYFKDKGRDVILTREPGGTPEAEKIRALLVQRDGGAWTPTAECLLFFAARQMHVETLIKPAMAKGKIVISDRFTDSTIAYQGYGHGFDLNIIEQVKKIALGDFEPDLTLLLDIPAREGIERSMKQKNMANGAESTEDRFEKMDISFHERLRDGFLKIAKSNPNRVRIVDATQSPDAMFNDIKTVLDQL